MRKLTIYSLRVGNTQDSYQAVVCLLRSQAIPYTEVVDFNKTMNMGRGKLNPAGDGFVVETSEQERLYDCIDVALWIEKNGYKQLA